MLHSHSFNRAGSNRLSIDISEMPRSARIVPLSGKRIEDLGYEKTAREQTSFELAPRVVRQLIQRARADR
jgi:hypothetical protein